MQKLNEKSLNYIVLETVLEKNGQFTINDIFEEVKKKIKKSIDDLLSYIIKKLDSMCDSGLIGKTEIYYFSL